MIGGQRLSTNHRLSTTSAMEKLWLFYLTRRFARFICRLYFRIEFVGVENVPAQAMIMAPNHVSYLDPLWVSIPLPRPLRYMTWDRMTQLPLLGPLIRAYGAFPVNVDRSDRAALRRSLEQLRAGGGLMIFPEGGRTRDGRLLPFKPGVIRLALDAAVPIVPVTIIGGYAAFSPHHFFPRPYKVKIVYHPPVHLTPPADPAERKRYLQEQADRLQAIVASALPPTAWPAREEPAIES